MTRIRITCKAPAPPPSMTVEPSRYDSQYPLICGVVASWIDTTVCLVTDDGKEHPITNCTGVVWESEEGSTPARATLSFVGVEIDVDARVDPVCSFCGKTRREIKRMVSPKSSVVAICDECVGLARAIVEAP